MSVSAHPSCVQDSSLVQCSVDQNQSSESKTAGGGRHKPSHTGIICSADDLVESITNCRTEKTDTSVQNDVSELGSVVERQQS